jgi:hypothetical protein
MFCENQIKKKRVKAAAKSLIFFHFEVAAAAEYYDNKFNSLFHSTEHFPLCVRVLFF